MTQSGCVRVRGMGASVWAGSLRAFGLGRWWRGAASVPTARLGKGEADPETLVRRETTGTGRSSPGRCTNFVQSLYRSCTRVGWRPSRPNGPLPSWFRTGVRYRASAQKRECRGMRLTVTDRYDPDVAQAYGALAYYHDHPPGRWPRPSASARRPSRNTRATTCWDRRASEERGIGSWRTRTSSGRCAGTWKRTVTTP